MCHLLHAHVVVHGVIALLSEFSCLIPGNDWCFRKRSGVIDSRENDARRDALKTSGCEGAAGRQLLPQRKKHQVLQDLRQHPGLAPAIFLKALLKEV
jgi:hypothetical protein